MTKKESEEGFEDLYEELDIIGEVRIYSITMKGVSATAKICRSKKEPNQFFVAKIMRVNQEDL